MGGKKPVGPVTAALRAMQQSVDEPNIEPEFINPAGDVIGLYSIGVLQYPRPNAKRRATVPIGIIEVGVHGCRASLRQGNFLGSFRTAAEAEAAILARAPVQPHPAALPPAGSARH